MNAPDKAREIKAAIAMVIAFLTALWGWMGWAILIWISLILLDYISGSMAAKREKNWSSAIARDGLWHKAGEIFAVLVAALCDIALDVIIQGSGITIPFDLSPMITPIVIMWYILTEAGSILENCGRLGAKVPKWFKQHVDQAKETIDKEQGEKFNVTLEVPKINGETVGKHEKQELEVSDPWETPEEKEEPPEIDYQALFEEEQTDGS